MVTSAVCGTFLSSCTWNCWYLQVVFKRNKYFQLESIYKSFCFGDPKQKNVKKNGT